MSMDHLTPEEQEALVAAHAANKYKRQREAEYPSWADQLDKIYHDGVDAWKADILAIKNKYPKPTP